jgi:Zn-dependent peptidase ImmA (M78 family)
MSEAELFQMERGERDLNLGQLERIATQYQFPLATLLMPAPLPPVPRPKLRDFRVFDGEAPPPDLSRETLLAIEDASLFVDTLEDVRDAAPELLPPLGLPQCSLDDDPEEVANAERERLDVSVEEQFAWLGDREAFLRWREVVESQGVFSCQLELGADGSRGFAIWDERQIPVIVIDSAEDPYPARVFTIWHEYAHILLRMGGISDQNRRNSVERFCNQFAAHFLMPREVFATYARVICPPGTRWTEHAVTRLAAQFKVSKSATTLHLENMGLAPKGLYREMLALWRGRKPSTSRGIATHIQKHANRLGSRHIDVMMQAVQQGVLTKLDAYELTNVKPKYFPELRREAIGRRAAFGRGS